METPLELLESKLLFMKFLTKFGRNKKEVLLMIPTYEKAIETLKNSK